MQISQFPKKILIILYKIHSIAHKAYVVGMAGSRWKRHIVVNSMQARLRAQLGDRSTSSSERRRRSVVVASIVLTITDPLRGSYCVHIAITKLRVLARKDTCMVFRIIWHLRCLHLFLPFLYFPQGVCVRCKKMPPFGVRGGIWYVCVKPRVGVRCGIFL